MRKLIVASANFRRDGLYPQFWEGMKHAKLSDMPAELREAYLKVAPHPEQLQSFHDKSVRRMLDFQDIPMDTIHGIEAPTMVMIGDADVLRPEHAVEMFRVLPHAQLAILPATDHMTFVKNVEPAAAMITAFLDGPIPAR